MLLHVLEAFILLLIQSTASKEISELKPCPVSGEITQPCKIIVAFVVCEGQRRREYIGSDLLYKISRQENQLRTVIKSIIYTKTKQRRNNSPDYVNLEFAIFTNKKSVFDDLHAEISTWNKTYIENMVLKHHEVDHPPGSECLSTLLRPCSAFRIFLPKILPNTESLIYLDTDIIFFRNILHLWQEFNTFSDTTMISAASDFRHKKFHSINVPVFNVGIMLMNLTRIRKIQNFESFFLERCESARQYRTGSQPILNLYFLRHPETHTVLNCTWQPMNFRYRPLTSPTCNLQEYGLSALHGVGGLFHISNQFKLFYQAFNRANMTGYDKKDQSVFKNIIKKLKSSKHYCDTTFKCKYIKQAVSKHMTSIQ